MESYKHRHNSNNDNSSELIKTMIVPAVIGGQGKVTKGIKSPIDKILRNISTIAEHVSDLLR